MAFQRMAMKSHGAVWERWGGGKVSYLCCLVILLRGVEEVTESDHPETHPRDLEDDEEADEGRPNARTEQDAHAVVEGYQVRRDELDEKDTDQ